MIPDDIDDLIRAHRPRVEVTPARLDRLADAVLERLPPRPAHPWWSRWRRLGIAWAPPLALARLSVLMTAAALLGLAVGTHLDEAQPAAQISTLFSTSSVFLIGS